MSVVTLLQSTTVRSRLAVCAGSLLVGIVIYMFMAGDAGILNIVCKHNLETADLSLFVDGRLAYSDRISGTVKRRFGVFDKKIEGTFSKTLNLAEGAHVIGVRLQSPAERFDQTKQIDVNLIPGKESTVVIAAQKGDLMLSYKGPPATFTNDTSSGYFGSVRSLLITGMGSIASAAIGFAVQEFLKSRKAALTAPRSSKTV